MYKVTATWVSRLFKLFFTTIIGLFAFTSFMWGIWWFGAFLTIISCLIWAKKTGPLVSLLAISILSLPFVFNAISDEMDYLGKLIRNQGPQALSTQEKISIYTGNIAMALGGFSIMAPEVALETLYLMRPSGKDKIFQSDFAMRSEHIQDLIDAYSKKVVNGSAPKQSKRIPLRWGAGSSTYSMFDYRVSLAVAGGGLFLDYEKTDVGYKIKCRITIDVKYSEGYKLPIINAYGVRLYIDEAIFSALQEIGWLHPYYAHYHWTLK
tara:strand:- start:38 stop:832 length:795 start_codon:yes stop_codon:yes gene_type:complete